MSDNNFYKNTADFFHPFGTALFSPAAPNAVVTPPVTVRE